MPTLYFDADEYDRTDGDGEDGEGMRAYPLAHHRMLLREEALTHVRLYPAVPMRGSSDFYCVELGFSGTRGADFHDCGRRCAEYEPRNGRNGCCLHRRHVYEPGPAVLLHADGRVEPFPHKGLMAQVLGTPGISWIAINEKAAADKRSVVEIVEEIAKELPDIDERP